MESAKRCVSAQVWCFCSAEYSESPIEGMLIAVFRISHPGDLPFLEPLLLAEGLSLRLDA